MLRYEELREFTDGKRYKASDMAGLDTHGCAGCSRCCESDMGSSLVLDPRDICCLTRATGKSFDELLTGFYIELGLTDGLILPHMKMDGEKRGCRFLDEHKRCSIHEARPGICRLFPLGRLYEEGGMCYILQKDECAVQPRGPLLIRDWIGIEPLEEYEAYILKWHRFLGLQKKRLAKASEELQKELQKDLLRIFYLRGWQEETFFQEISERMREASAEFRRLTEEDSARRHEKWMEENGETLKKIAAEADRQE